MRKAFERLERLDGKLSRVVLRGGRGSNAVSLPDMANLRIRVELFASHFPLLLSIGAKRTDITHSKFIVS